MGILSTVVLKVMLETFMVNLLGPAEFRIGENLLVRPPRRKGLVVLAHLVLKSPQPLSRHALAQTIWPDSLPEQGRLGLRQALVDLRKSMNNHAFRILAPDTQTLAFDPEGASIDVVNFQEAMREGTISRSKLEEIQRLYRGPLCSDWSELSLEPFRNQICRLALEFLAKGVRESIRRKDRDLALSFAEFAVHLDPINEQSCRTLMSLLADDGRVSDALEAFRALKAHLKHRLDLEPSLQTVELSISVRERLNQKIYALELTPVPLKKPDDNILAKHSNAKVPRTFHSLIGRDSELSMITDLLERESLVTIAGLGGVGKTRLAQELGSQLAERQVFYDGVDYVSFVDLVDPQLVKEHLLECLGVPVHPRQSEQQLEAYFGNRQNLLIVDNCEHLLEAIAEMISRVLAVGMQTKILTTSREPLSLYGECVIPLSPLKCPPEVIDPVEVRNSPAVKLFTQRAEIACLATIRSPGFLNYAAQICRKLDGIPLALELAAARLKSLSVDQVAEKVDDRFELLRGQERNRPGRHQTMEATIDASYQLLSDGEKRFFRWISVFEGGFTLESATGVFGTESILEIISRLIDASLIYIPDFASRPLRYSMLETIRAFGKTRLQDLGELQAARAAHLLEMVRLTGCLRDEMSTRRQTAAVGQVEAERANWRSALDNCPDDQSYVQIVHNLTRYWMYGHRPSEAKRYTETAIEKSTNVQPCLRARTYSNAGALFWEGCAGMASTQLLTCAVEISGQADCREEKAAALMNLGLTLLGLENYEQAYQCVTNSLESWTGKEPGNAWLRIQANLGRIAREWGRYELAGTHFDEALTSAHLEDFPLEHSYALVNAAWNDVLRGQKVVACSRFLKSLEIFSETQDLYKLAVLFLFLSRFAFRERDYERSVAFKWMRLIVGEQLSDGKDPLSTEIPTEDEWPELVTQLLTTKVFEIRGECRSWPIERFISFARDYCIGFSD